MAPLASHPVLELLARYRAVLAAAWAARRELAGPARLADEAAFLPAAMSLQATPVHPAPRRAAWAIMAVFLSALAWACIGQVDIVAVAPGRIVVSQRTKTVQPLQAAVVRGIHVKDGDRVQAGQLLVELDPTETSADAGMVQQQLRAAQGDAQRSQALLQALASGPERRASAAPPRLAPAASVEVQALLAAEWQDLAARLARAAAEATRREAELATHRQQLAKLQTLLPLARQREADIQALSAQGFVAGHAGQDRTRERLELERDQATQQARIVEAQAALAEARQTHAAQRADAQRLHSDRLAQARLKQAQLQQEAAKATARSELTRLVAPVAGTVQQLAVHTPGGVVTPAQVLMVIVPVDAVVTAEVVLENKDIGFVKVGQQAEVKLEAFPFTRYGTVQATVSLVSADAVVDEKRGPVFPTTLRLLARDIQVDGRRVALVPGMALSGELKTGRRRVIDFLLSPVRQRVGESALER